LFCMGRGEKVNNNRKHAMGSDHCGAGNDKRGELRGSEQQSTLTLVTASRNFKKAQYGMEETSLENSKTVSERQMHRGQSFSAHHALSISCNMPGPVRYCAQRISTCDFHFPCRKEAL